MSKIIGVDVAKDFIVAYDGKNFYVYGNSKRGLKSRLPKRKKIKVIHVNDISQIASTGDKVILEQTGNYGLRYVKLFNEAGAEVYVADGKSLHRFRVGKREEKDDYVDAQAIREIFFSPRRRQVHKFHYERYRLRTLVRHYQRLNKELTRSVNRLKQQLVHLFPKENYHNLTRYKLFKCLKELEVELIKNPDATTLVAVSEVRNISNLLESLNTLKAEIESIVKNHPDYEILKSFDFGIMQMAALIGYYWDINLFKSKNAFISYCLMGVRKEQSGESLNRVKTDRNRSEIKGIMFMHFKSAHKTNSPYLPLVSYLRFRESEYKKRFIKYLDKVFELVYYGLKYRMTFSEVIKKAIKEKETQLQLLKKKITRVENINYRKRLLERYRYTSDLLLVCQDISTRLQKATRASGVECRDYYEKNYVDLAQLARAPACQAGGHGFESRSPRQSQPSPPPSSPSSGPFWGPSP